MFLYFLIYLVSYKILFLFFKKSGIKFNSKFSIYLMDDLLTIIPLFYLIHPIYFWLISVAGEFYHVSFP